MAALLGLGAYVLFRDDSGAPGLDRGDEPAAAVENPGGEGQAGPTKGIGTLVKLDIFIVNLNEPGGNRYLKVGLELELKDSAAQAAVERLKPLLRHQTIAYLSNLTYAQTQGLVAKERIRLDLLSRINGALEEPGIRSVYFNEFLIQ